GGVGEGRQRWRGVGPRERRPDHRRRDYPGRATLTRWPLRAHSTPPSTRTVVATPSIFASQRISRQRVWSSIPRRFRACHSVGRLPCELLSVAETTGARRWKGRYVTARTVSAGSA